MGNGVKDKAGKTHRLCLNVFPNPKFRELYSDYYRILDEGLNLYCMKK